MSEQNGEERRVYRDDVAGLRDQGAQAVSVKCGGVYFEDASRLNDDEFKEVVADYVFCTRKIFWKMTVEAVYRPELDFLSASMGKDVSESALAIYIAGEGKISFGAICRVVEVLFLKHGKGAVKALEASACSNSAVLESDLDDVVGGIEDAFSELH
jgi:hypothetical protein